VLAGVVLGVVAGVLGVVVAMLGVVLGTVVVAVLAAGGAVVVTAGMLAVTVAEVLLAGVAGVLAVEPESPASETSAAVSTPSESTITTARAVIRPFQLGAAASLVRAAAPQRRHHSCVGCSGAPHSGQASPAGTAAPVASCAAV